MATKRANAIRQIRNQENIAARLDRIEAILEIAFPEAVQAVDAPDDEDVPADEPEVKTKDNAKK